MVHCVYLSYCVFVCMQHSYVLYATKCLKNKICSDCVERTCKAYVGSKLIIRRRLKSRQVEAVLVTSSCVAGG